MANDIQPARGFRDYGPLEKQKREAVLSSIRRSYARFGFREIETPAMEPLERLQSNMGGENEKMVFKVLRRGLPAEEPIVPSEACDLGLRYDLTVPLVRFHATHAHELPAVFRAMQIGAVWRAERPQKGRYRQFLQCDIDTLGEPGVAAEIELVNATLTALEDLGVEGCSVRLNDRRILDSLLGAYGIPAEQRAGALIQIDKLDKIGPSGVSESLAKAGIAEEAVSHVGTLLEDLTSTDEADFDRVVELLPAGIDVEGLSAITEIRDALHAINPAARVVFDPSLVRGMGYYTGPIFEIAHPSSSSSVAGGGRYDRMAEKLFGKPMPACGFSIGFERIIGLVDDATLGTAETVTAILHTDVPAAKLVGLQARCVRRGESVILAKRAKNMSKQLTDLQAQGATHFCVIEGDIDADIEPETRPLER